MGTKFFEIFGKVAVVAIILGIVGGGAYYFGTMKEGDVPKEKEFVVATSDSSVSPTETPNSVKPTSAVTKKQMSAGASSHTQYTVFIPSDWQTDHTLAEADMDKLIISKNGFSVTIYQANMGGSMYSFADAKVDGPMAQEYTGTYTDFTGVTGEKYRRIDASVQNKPGEKNYSVLVFGSDAYQSPTTFGGISYTTPVSPDEKMLETMDSIISSLKK